MKKYSVKFRNIYLNFVCDCYNIEVYNDCGFDKIKLQNLILHNTHCNGYVQIFKENSSQNQRFCDETEMFRLTITIIMPNGGLCRAYATG